jgi:hypothetical protein
VPTQPAPAAPAEASVEDAANLSTYMIALGMLS